MYMPNPQAQQFKRIAVQVLDPLPIHPPPLTTFQPTERLTRKRLDALLATITPCFLCEEEIALLAHVLWRQQCAIAFTNNKRSTFSSHYYPNYEIPVIEHTPWAANLPHIPHAL